jgi:hypothetical protein
MSKKCLVTTLIGCWKWKKMAQMFGNPPINNRDQLTSA